VAFAAQDESPHERKRDEEDRDVCERAAARDLRHPHRSIVRRESARVALTPC
jgi:hypothetical protein